MSPLKVIIRKINTNKDSVDKKVKVVFDRYIEGINARELMRKIVGKILQLRPDRKPIRMIDRKYALSKKLSEFILLR